MNNVNNSHSKTDWEPQPLYVPYDNDCLCVADDDIWTKTPKKYD